MFINSPINPDVLYIHKVLMVQRKSLVPRKSPKNVPESIGPWVLCGKSTPFVLGKLGSIPIVSTFPGPDESTMFHDERW